VFHSDHRGFSGGTAFVLDFEAIEIGEQLVGPREKRFRDSDSNSLWPS
jgi:hypothetical protein